MQHSALEIGSITCRLEKTAQHLALPFAAVEEMTHGDVKSQSSESEKS